MSEQWEPLSEERAAEIIGVGVHTGLRKGSEAPDAASLWEAIADSDAWVDAVEYAVRSLTEMGLALCEKVEVDTMSVFIFENVAQLTGNYHSGGGMAVIARDRAHVEEQIAAHNDGLSNRGWGAGFSGEIALSEEDWKDVRSLVLASEAKPEIFIFPDAGCC